MRRGLHPVSDAGPGNAEEVDVSRMSPESSEISTRKRSRWPLAAAALLVVVAAVGVAIYFTAGSSNEPTYAWEFNGTFEEEGGGPAARSLGETFGDEGFMFEPSTGLSLDVDLGKGYTIETRLRMDDDNPQDRRRYAKLFDFKDRIPDAGLYVYQERQLLFYFSKGCGDVEDAAQGCAQSGQDRKPFSTVVGAWQMDTFHTIRLVRDAEAGTVTLYVDDELLPLSPRAVPTPQSPFVDSMDDFASEYVQGETKKLVVVIDDRVTSGEAGYGEIDYIHITVQ